MTPQEEKAPHRHEFQFYSGDAVFLDTFARFYCCCPRRSGVAFRKLAQFSFRHSKFRGAPIQTERLIASSYTMRCASKTLGTERLHFYPIRVSNKAQASNAAKNYTTLRFSRILLFSSLGKCLRSNARSRFFAEGPVRSRRTYLSPI
jgi:hypothetical protein